MLRKFIEGIFYGLGFTFAFFLITSLWLMYLAPTLLISEKKSVSDFSSEIKKVEPLHNSTSNSLVDGFYKLSVDEKIGQSTAIIITKITKDENGRYESHVKEILKQGKNVELYYEVGDKYQDHNYYSDETIGEQLVPDGFIVFMDGNPAKMRYSVSFSGERIDSLGSIPIILFKKKCEELND